MQNNVDDEIQRVLSWSLADRMKLLENLQASISQSQQANVKPHQRHKAQEFEGACRNTWKDVDVEEYLRQARLLSLENEARLLEALMADLRQRLEGQQYHSIMELKGLGKELWQGINVEKYIEEERSSWRG